MCIVRTTSHVSSHVNRTRRIQTLLFRIPLTEFVYHIETIGPNMLNASASTGVKEHSNRLNKLNQNCHVAFSRMAEETVNYLDKFYVVGVSERLLCFEVSRFYFSSFEKYPR